MNEDRGERHGTGKLFLVAGLLAAGFLAGRRVLGGNTRFGRWSDGLLRRMLFQSKKETVVTQARSAASLASEAATSFYQRFMGHNIMTVSASGAFFILLGIFPGLAALVALYGLVGDPAQIKTFIAAMPDIVPQDVVQLIQNFLNQLISRPSANLTTFIIGFVISLWSANSAMKSLIDSLNVVYECRESRSFVWLNILATLMTLTFLVFMIAAVNIMVLPVWDWLLQAFGGEFLWLRWVVLLFAVQVLISLLYYVAPCGRRQGWQLFTAGASVAALSWVIMSLLFSIYLTNFANYSVTYGSLGAAAILMTWLWLTVTILLAGAELDAAITHLGSEEQ